MHGEIREVPEDSWESRPSSSGTESQESQESEDLGIKSSSTKRISPPRDSKRHNNRDDDTMDSSEDDPVPAHFDHDSDVEKVINYKLPTNPDAFNICPETEMIESRGSKPPKGQFKPKWWHDHTVAHRWDERKPFFPCSHEGSCEQARCRCFRENITCEKTCMCSPECVRRFPGCSCAATNVKRVCASTSCLCFKFNRECDADLCENCGADKKYTNCAPKNLLCNTVSRLALYATTDIKAGTELFFFYSYPSETTAEFKQPTRGKAGVVAVKQKVKPIAKQKVQATARREPRSRSSSSFSLKSSQLSTLGQPSDHRDRLLTGLGRARAAKKEKRNTALRSQSLKGESPSGSDGSQRSRKAASNPVGGIRSSRLSQLNRRRVDRLRRSNSENRSYVSDYSAGADDSDMLPQSTVLEEDKVIQDTEGEDDDFIMEDVHTVGESDHSMFDGEATGIEKSAGGGRIETRQRRSQRSKPMAPVVATSRKKKSKKGGARLGPGTKRRIVLQSDDE